MTPASRTTGIATVVTDRIHFDTKGNADMVNLTADVRRIVEESASRREPSPCSSPEPQEPSPRSSSSRE